MASYCSKCGSHLKLVQKKVVGYTTNTGKKIYKAQLVCPLRGSGWFDPHDKWDGTITEGSEKFEYDMKYSDF